MIYKFRYKEKIEFLIYLKKTYSITIAYDEMVTITFKYLDFILKIL